MRNKLRGHSYGIVSACAAGAHAIGMSGGLDPPVGRRRRRRHRRLRGGIDAALQGLDLRRRSTRCRGQRHLASLRRPPRRLRDLRRGRRGARARGRREGQGARGHDPRDRQGLRADDRRRARPRWEAKAAARRASVPVSRSARRWTDVAPLRRAHASAGRGRGRVVLGEHPGPAVGDQRGARRERAGDRRRRRGRGGHGRAPAA